MKTLLRIMIVFVMMFTTQCSETTPQEEVLRFNYDTLRNDVTKVDIVIFESRTIYYVKTIDYSKKDDFLKDLSEVVFYEIGEDKAFFGPSGICFRLYSKDGSSKIVDDDLTVMNDKINTECSYKDFNALIDKYYKVRGDNL